MQKKKRFTSFILTKKYNPDMIITFIMHFTLHTIHEAFYGLQRTALSVIMVI